MTYQKFIKHKEPRTSKWHKVAKKEYKETVFATLVKGEDIGTEFKNKWLLMDNEVAGIQDVINKIVLCHHSKINDSNYAPGLTIRPLQIVEEIQKVGMFNEKFNKVILESEVDDSIEISQKLSDFKVLGVRL